MISSYQEALRFLYDNLPMFQRVGPVAIRRDLANTWRLCSLLGDPQEKFKSIHVAGTNGKGSTCHMLASILQTAGYRTGLYTSPHLKEFTERIKINGQEVSQSYVLDFVNRIRPAIDEIAPSFFEITVAMAFDYFAQEGVDIAVIETGLGGRLDSTNVITPVLSVITNISFDHKDVLGETIEEIAGEKAGIIKEGVPVVISERQDEVADIFRLSAQHLHADIFFASDQYTVDNEGAPEVLVVSDYSVPKFTLRSFPLKGIYQHRNLPGVVKAVDLLQHDFPIAEEDVVSGLEEVALNTGLKGRWQVLGNSPTVVCDTGHNEGGIREVVRQLARERFERMFIVLGVVKDKDARQILSLLPSDARYIFCQAKLPRAMDAHRLQEIAASVGLQGIVIPDVNDAKRFAISQASADDLVFIGGSTYVVAELEEI